MVDWSTTGRLASYEADQTMAYMVEVGAGDFFGYSTFVQDLYIP